jgi:REP element-mobilizing transposase RayT
MEIGRKKLPHETPLGILPEEAIFFITICAKQRGSTVLTAHSFAVLEAVRQRHSSGVWFCRIFVIMPDHVHALLRFPNPAHPMPKAVSDFKRWTARAGQFHWQRDFFEHRLRSNESVHEKADYILRNPVCAGLAASPDLWPYVFITRDTLG